jgi:zona occludens toxin (predicted ATPase)
MITVITAVPGSGKSLYCIGLIVAAVKAKRPVYSNIEGLLVEGCYPAPDDWRDTPEGSLVIYDEAQQPHLYPSTAHRGEIKDERLRSMEVHRHSGHDLVFVSQSQSFLHHHIRKLAGEHIHLYRAFGAKTVTKYTWQHCVDSPNDRSEQARADSFPWSFPKEHFALYKSATVHTHKFKIPKKLAAMVAFICVVAGLTFWNAASSESSYLLGSSPESDKPVESLSSKAASSALGGVGSAATPIPKKAATTTIYDWTDTVQATPVSGCISSATKCQCFSAEGALLKMAYAQCLSVIKNPLPRTIMVGSGGAGGSSQANLVQQSQPFSQPAREQPAQIVSVGGGNPGHLW